MIQLLFTLKKDTYRISRGGYARFLNIYCKTCGYHLLLYQKDGPGPLKRLYVDRIFAPKEVLAQWKGKNLLKTCPLKCTYCQISLAKPYLYEKEARPALLLKENSIIKKVAKGIYPPKIAKIFAGCHMDDCNVGETTIHFPTGRDPS